MSETKQSDCNNSNTKSNYESKAMVLWRFDNPYANYKKDTERIFVFNGYTRSGCGLVGLAAWIKGGKIDFTGTKTNINHTKMNVEKNVKLILEQQNQKSQVGNKNIKELRKVDVELPEPDDTKNIMHVNNFGTFDIILASELLYLPELHKDLVKTMKYYCHRNDQNKGDKKNEKRNTRILGIYKERGLSESSFFEIAKTLGKFNVEWIDMNWISQKFNMVNEISKISLIADYKLFWLIISEALLTKTLELEQLQLEPQLQLRPQGHSNS
ncbi:3211_t:CDS:2 [Diversispora eburnea]|uniref:3211_t:CDS:1 n=1 Tax=Diversispora eburnea TaxID=1213867 RepID=A0A9N9BIX9_9GLOM|nr:3211_t:CDS:2 [Diversispora eburnea]